MFLRRALMAEDISTPTISRWVRVVLDYVGLGFILASPEEWLRGSSARVYVSCFFIGSAFLFLGILGPRIWSGSSAVVRRLVTLILSFCVLSILVYWLGSTISKFLAVLWNWLIGQHGRWFDRSVGALYAVGVSLA